MWSFRSCNRFLSLRGFVVLLKGEELPKRSRITSQNMTSLSVHTFKNYKSRRLILIMHALHIVSSSDSDSTQIEPCTDTLIDPNPTQCQGTLQPTFPVDDHLGPGVERSCRSLLGDAGGLGGVVYRA